RLTKRNEGVRKDLITNTAKFVLDGFHEGGKYLTDFSKAALSAVVLRTDLASLLADDRFSLDQIRLLVSDRIALKQATMDMESRLAGLTHAQSYMNGAKALGLFLASGEVGA